MNLVGEGMGGWGEVVFLKSICDRLSNGIMHSIVLKKSS